jgi:hypothetical protein
VRFLIQRKLLENPNMKIPILRKFLKNANVKFPYHSPFIHKQNIYVSWGVEFATYIQEVTNLFFR